MVTALISGNLRINYDDSSDVLYLSIGEPRPALTREAEEDDTFLVRTDRDTGEMVGITILDYYQHFRQLSDLSWLRKWHFPHDVLDFLSSRLAL
jgi:uncharacterized protein YuzE